MSGASSRRHRAGDHTGGRGGGGEARALALERTREALAVLAKEGGQQMLLVENIPAHYHRADGTTGVMLTGQGVMDHLGWRDHVAGLCLDTAHAFLTPGGATTLQMYVRRLAKNIRHVHLADAAPPDHEGLPLGEGQIDWDFLASRLLADRPQITAVPEVKGGHERDGAGFQEALADARRLMIPGGGMKCHDSWN
jgi:sugar phosphate isomerase/epimerase